MLSRTTIQIERLAFVTVAVAILAMTSSPASVSADVFVTTTGDEIEGELIEELKDAYRIRTYIGIVDLEKERVARVVKKVSPWAKYESRRRKCEPTADAHYALSLWCKRQNLDSEARDELARAIQLDPNHAPAREALGYVQDKRGRWVRPKSSKAPTPEERAARRAIEEEERLLRKLVTEWFIKIKAIHKGRLSGRGGMDKFAQGREQILSIRDPLAIPAIAGVLSTGDENARLLMVEALGQFEEDEATMNLLVASLLDPSDRIRRSAAQVMLTRRDERIVRRLASALYSEEEALLRNAATALGVLKAKSAVDDLIDVLSKEVQARVRVSRPAFLDGVQSDFCGYSRYRHGQRYLRYQPTGIFSLGPGSMIGTISYVETQTVLIHRTEVQEALIAITGQNFGFDPVAWRKWWMQQQGG